MILLDDDRCIEMQHGEYDQVARPLLEHLVQVPDFEMAAHADQQRALAHPPPRSHPGCDAEPSLAVHLRGRDEPEPPSQQRIALPGVTRALAAELGKLGQRTMMCGNASAIVDQQARIVGMETDEQIIVRLPCLYRDAEMLGKDQFATCTDRRYCTSHKEVFHRRNILNTYEVPVSQCWRLLLREPPSCSADTGLMKR